MLFAESACKPFDEHATPRTSDAYQQRVSGVPRFVRK